VVLDVACGFALTRCESQCETASGVEHDPALPALKITWRFGWDLEMDSKSVSSVKSVVDPSSFVTDALNSSSMWELIGPMGLSIRVAVLATLVAGALAVPVGFLMARARFRGRALVEALLLVPLVLPPTVVGYGLVVLMGRRGWVGAWLDQALGYGVLFHWHGAVLAAGVVAFPLLYFPARAGFASVEREAEDVAKLMGASLLQVFWHVSLPSARRAIVGGAVLGFGRALGEFGATMMVVGDTPGQQTLPVAVYSYYLSGDHTAANLSCVLLVLVSLCIVLVYNRSHASRQD